ncbi:zf-HC2 domain-containing protein [Aneurinibacillus aneurinilyticus]|uniref:Anti-sigma-W factor RsiW n=1 Tax=Aneurinibacillus aneurinilyticus TaxID=1391 RepID=A0A848CUJ8_ANEAE|nr:zf-HC2 domain-containing protein [Aneurinibacillus aneurinilyticus]MCI1696217.1 zf-HC2 domain-containing protein [Aneurinibacillus aneurinilyticus]NME98059.1 hypothetical protein [Aneurinibacillus aneurinilyticus]
MNCLNERSLQAYLDGEINRETRKNIASHLEHCAECCTRMERAKKLEQWTELALAESFPEPLLTDAEINTEAAWKRFEQRLHTDNVTFINKKAGKTMKKPYKKWITGTAAAAVLLGSLAIPQVQAAANSFLSIFRVDQVEMVKLTQSDLQEIESWLANGEDGMKEIKGIGKVWVEDKDLNKEHQYFQTAEEAQKAGYEIPSAPEDYRFVDANISSGFTMHAQLNTDKANALLKQVKAETHFNENLNNKPFSIKVPDMKHYQFTAKANEGERSSDRIFYTVTGTPEIQVPENVDLNEVRQTVLSLPFIPQNVKQQLAGIEDWQRTLPIPYVADDKNKVRKITVQGVKGFAYETENGSFLVWQKDGKIHHLEAYDNKAAKHTDTLIALANQIK